MTESIHAVLEALPSSSLTTHVLGALDYIVPGEWTNITLFEDMIKKVTGEEDSALIQQVGERAIALWFDESQGYQRAVTIFKLVDSGSTLAGTTSLLNIAGDKFDALAFLGDITPKPDTVQTIDACVKLAAELTTFCMVNGFPGDSVGDFASALMNYEKEDSMRFAAWLALDCVLPLGPDFLDKILEKIHSLSESDITENRIFRLVADHMPGGIGEKKKLLQDNLTAQSDHIRGFVAAKGIDQGSVLEKVRSYVKLADDKLDVVAAVLDMSTNYFEHTGIQSVARKVIARAYGEI